jgi:mannose-6-phosphate isomerase-like protein (cupin superfamily)
MIFPKHGLSKFMLSEAKALDWFEPLPGENIAMRIESGQTHNAFSLTEIVVAAQAGPPLHVHHDADEALYVLEGTVDFVCDNERFRIGPGGLAAVPKGIPHAFRNFEIAPVRMLVMLSPGGFEQFMRAMNGRSPSDAAAVGAAYHMEIVGPQISALR